MSPSIVSAGIALDIPIRYDWITTLIDHLLLVPSIGIDLIPGTELKLWAFGAVISRVSSVMVDTDRPLGVHRGLGSRMNRSGMDLGL